MEAVADLHIHSIFSDGILAPSDIFEKAEGKGISAISITDHDNIEGCINAQDICSDYNVEFVNGVELSCYEDGREYHILGYFFDLDNKKLNSHLVDYKLSRLKRAEKIIEKLNRLDIQISFDRILEIAGSAPITRPHIASAMTDMGFTSTMKEAFILYLGDGKPAYEAKKPFTVAHAIKMLNDAGGVAVLAHPARMVTQDKLYRMINEGLDGVEVIHPMHDVFLQKLYHNLASQYWLIETGGSDYHGYRDWDEGNFGKFVIPYTTVESMKYHVVK